MRRVSPGRVTALAVSVLISVVVGVPGLAAEPDALELEPLVVREPERREVSVADIDSENWEVGLFGGLLSVEDFGSHAVAGVRAAYHVTEAVFVEAAYGRSRLGRTSFERLSGDAEIVTGSDRDLAYYDLAVGYSLFPGESFIGRSRAWKGGLHLAIGAGATQFAGDDRFTVTLGAGYRLLPTDWLSLRLEVRDHVFQSDLLGSRETLHNLEISAGLAIFF